jgi:multiple sugar transport system substrate-binding protein
LSSGRDPFLGGDILTRFTGPWEIAHAEKFKSDGFEYGFAPMPVPDDFKGDPYTYGDTKNIVIFKTCRDYKLAWSFLQEFLEEHNEKKFLTITNQFPRRKDLTTNPLFSDYFSKNPLMFPFAVQTKHVVGPDVCPVLKEVFDVISQEYEAAVVYSRKQPAQAVHDAAKATNLVLLQ